MGKVAVVGCLLALISQPSLADDYGGLTLGATCEDFNGSSVSDRVGFLHDIIVRTSATTGKDYAAHRVDIEACVAATFAPPCVSQSTQMREILAMCMLMVGQ
jgi:hypothetical protein